MKLIIAVAIASSGTAALAQAHDHSSDTVANAAHQPDAAARPGNGSCPMMDKPQKQAGPDKGLGGMVTGMGAMGTNGSKGAMGANADAPMQQSCPMMAKGSQAATPETGKTLPDKDTDHAEHH
jgi:hypothetical protein